MSRTRTPRFRVFPWALFRQVFARFFILSVFLTGAVLGAFCALHAIVTWSFDAFAAIDGSAVRAALLTSAIISFFVALTAADAKLRNLDPKGEEE